MSTRRTILAMLAAAIARAQEVVFRSDVRLVRLITSVKNQNGEPVGGLEKTQFRIYDNGAQQEVSVFERRTEQPLSVALLLDISGSTAKDLPYEFESLKRFVRALFSEGNPEDTAALFTFNYEVRQRTPFTRRAKRIEDDMRAIKAEAGTSLYDAILLASGDIASRNGRHVLVVITDGGDTTSSTDYHRALEAAHRADAVIYSILVIPILNDAGRNTGGEHALAQFATGSGGKVFEPTVGARLDAAFNEILRDLRTQYVLGYYPKNVPLTKDRWHTLRLEIMGDGLQARTRSGYYGEAEPSVEPVNRRGPRPPN